MFLYYVFLYGKLLFCSDNDIGEPMEIYNPNFLDKRMVVKSEYGDVRILDSENQCKDKILDEARFIKDKSGKYKIKFKNFYLSINDDYTVGVERNRCKASSFELRSLGNGYNILFRCKCFTQAEKNGKLYLHTCNGNLSRFQLFDFNFLRSGNPIRSILKDITYDDSKNRIKIKDLDFNLVKRFEDNIYDKRFIDSFKFVFDPKFCKFNTNVCCRYRC